MKIGANLILSKDGVGTLYLGKDANLEVTYNLDARPGSKLVVDMRGCTERKVVLATFGKVTNAFDKANVEVLSDPGAAYRVAVRDNRITATSVKGLVMIVQ